MTNFSKKVKGYAGVQHAIVTFSEHKIDQSQYSEKKLMINISD
jgi:hypothetical protein